MSKCIRKHEHLSTRGQCLDCGEPAHKIIKALQQENEALRNKAAKGVHTCHANCPRPMCVLTRENGTLKEKLDTLVGLVREYRTGDEAEEEAMFTYAEEVGGSE